MESTDQESFAQIFAATSWRLMAYCLRHVGPQAAEDAVAETYAVAWRKRQHLPADPLPWLIVTARNTMHSQQRRHARQQRSGPDQRV